MRKSDMNLTFEVFSYVSWIQLFKSKDKITMACYQSGLLYKRRKRKKKIGVHYEAHWGTKTSKQYNKTLTWLFKDWEKYRGFYGQFAQHLSTAPRHDVIVYQWFMFKRKKGKTYTKAWGVIALNNLGYKVVGP